MKKLMGLAYSSHFEAQRQMDVFLPEASANGKGLLFIHGGGWHAGKRDQWHEAAAYFCERGYMCASASYRLVPHTVYPGPIEDVRLAMSFFKEQLAQAGGDPEAVAVIGSSAGGHLAAMLATIGADDTLGSSSGETRKYADTRPQAAILYCPATDLHIDHNVRLHEPIGNLMGQSEQDIPHLYSEASPVDRLDAAHPPTLLIHGDADEVIPLAHTIRYTKKLEALDIKAELRVLTGVGHGFGYGVTTPAQIESIEAAAQFLKRVLP